MVSDDENEYERGVIDEAVKIRRKRKPHHDKLFMEEAKQIRKERRTPEQQAKMDARNRANWEGHPKTGRPKKR